MVKFRDVVNSDKEDRLQGFEWQLLRESVYHRDNGRCKKCNMSIEYSYVTDHIVPLALGGSNDRSNLQTLCIECDKLKTIKDRENIRRVQKFKRMGGKF